MARTKIIPDTTVFAALRHLLTTEGAQAASFRAIGRATGLAAATLVQRYGSAEGMLLAAMQDGWDRADAALAAAEVATQNGGAAALLKALPPTPPLLIQPALMARAAEWQRQVIHALAARLSDKQAAAVMFAAWQGRMMWERTGTRGFSLRDVQRRLT